MSEPLTDEEFDIYKGMRFSFVNAKEWQRLIAKVDSLKDKLKIADEAGMAWIKLCDKRKEENAKQRVSLDHCWQGVDDANKLFDECEKLKEENAKLKEKVEDLRYEIREQD